ncbi:MAG: cupredoxin domain-containing protein [Candidatus Curtissbacteria bacterium]|nr:cupredoxin domain-containing protein [Candidatus Curtissbacteria bacterium]
MFDILYKKISIIGLVIVLGLVLSACKKTSNNTTVDSTQNTFPSSNNQSDTGDSQSITIAMTDSGFSSQSAKVKSGGTINWVNNSSATIQVASDPHPTHTANREITNGQVTIVLAPGESSSVTVTKTGSWGYHDHLNASTKGTVVVE